MVESQGRKLSVRQGDIRRFVNQQMDRHRKPAFVFAVGYKIECLNELPVNHAHKVVEDLSLSGIQQNRAIFFSPISFQMEVVGVGQPFAICGRLKAERRTPTLIKIDFRVFFRLPS